MPEWYNDLKTELTSKTDHHESLKPVVYTVHVILLG
jgi:hypothetical protein